MAEKETQEIQPQETSFEVTELDDESLEGASGGLESVPTNENCHGC
jgi:hypothetical protein